MLKYNQFLLENINLNLHGIHFKVREKNDNLYFIVYDDNEDIIGYFKIVKQQNFYTMNEVASERKLGINLYMIAIFIASEKSLGLKPDSNGNTNQYAKKVWDRLITRSDLFNKEGALFFKNTNNLEYRRILNKTKFATDLDVKKGEKYFHDKINSYK